jgi:phage terminase large subunit GpA-like protein
MYDLEMVGTDWLIEEVENLIEYIPHTTPVEFNEEHRYLPRSVTNQPGYISYDLFPYLIEILNCFDEKNGVREFSLMKGVQVGWTTLLESCMLYAMAHVKTLPCMFMTADKELASARIENNVLPMLQQSGFEDILRSSDEGNSRKTGKTVNHLQWDGGGYMVPFGANNAAKMRSFSIAIFFKDEIDGWPTYVGKDGCPDEVSDDRCSAYWDRRKILRGSTPLKNPGSKINKSYKLGDQRKYLVKCLNPECRFPQSLRWHTEDKDTGVIGGFIWKQDGRSLDIESVRYLCQKCGHEHAEHDKERLFELANAEWVPTAKPSQPGIRSYHLPAMYSPIGFQPWYKCVASFLAGYDPVTRKVVDIAAYQKFYNNILGEPFTIMGSKVKFVHVSAHRRQGYKFGEVPNKYALQYSGSRIMFLTCTVDVHKSNLAVTVMGWTRDARTYVIDYWRFEVEGDEETCEEISHPVWGRMRKLIEETTYIADDGQGYRILYTLVDAGFANDTINTFCSDYTSGVVPILGRTRPAKNQRILEFAEFTTQAGTIGFRILVDHYKDRIAPVLRREWVEEVGLQDRYHFNAPLDITDKQLKELTVETRVEETDANGGTTYVWKRPKGAFNELWDLLGYGHACVEIIAWNICIKHFELETIEWGRFWDYADAPENDALFGRFTTTGDSV